MDGRMTYPRRRPFRSEPRALAREKMDAIFAIFARAASMGAWTIKVDVDFDFEHVSVGWA